MAPTAPRMASIVTRAPVDVATCQRHTNHQCIYESSTCRDAYIRIVNLPETYMYDSSTYQRRICTNHLHSRDVYTRMTNLPEAYIYDDGEHCHQGAGGRRHLTATCIHESFTCRDIYLRVINLPETYMHESSTCQKRICTRTASIATRALVDVATRKRRVYTNHQPAETYIYESSTYQRSI